MFSDGNVVALCCVAEKFKFFRVCSDHLWQEVVDLLCVFCCFCFSV